MLRKMFRKQKVHPVFKKLEFYLNLNNDFALTFLREALREFISFFGSIEKIPDMVKAGDATKMKNVTVAAAV